MKLQRSHIIISILLVAIVALLVFTIQQNTGGGVAPTPPSTTVTGTVTSVQKNSNFSLVFFLDIRTRISYGTVVLNSTGSPATCSIQPCTYSRILLYSNKVYNVTIRELVTTTVQGGGRFNVPRDCQVALPYTPTTPSEIQNMFCNTTF